ncbi:putative N-methylproline demethylase [Roseovarius litorisediminis]|uniref:Putative N-methylproline demethylase n=1 Tax=Roseovarius litorisediminis TaxID=1312363 RepID=A0A1Y5RIJ3_9RHOB|nr:FAD-dependent oxidoreductase [Roseovarius litorisediminis]SLN18360.1 putative N-methylproline demethylase [Roseovarius litorisediminis]
MSDFPRLTSELPLRHKVLRNRITFGAHTANMSVNGLPGEQFGAYLLERAIGGAGMIVAEPMPVHRTGVLTRGNFLAEDDAVIPAFRKIVEPVQDAGAVVLQQLYHVGAHGDSDLSYQPHWGPSGLPSYHDSDGSHAMTGAEIEEMIAAFVAAAVRCRDAGFDGVEIWAAYQSLLEQFWTPWSNRRDDQWGGPLENRTRISMRILEGIRRACGENFIVGMSVSYSDSFDVTLGIEELTEVLALHDATGHLDYVSCGSGGYLDFEKLMPTFVLGEKPTVSATEVFKQELRHAKVQAESQIRTPENAESVLSANQADLVSIVRGQIADPNLARKVTEGRADDIRGCISCNQMCWGRRSRDYWISCLINPSVGREYQWGGDRFIKSKAPKSVLVVGGGPSGLEAARVAAERGHKVQIHEAASQIGGQFRLAGMQPRRAQILDLMGWYERQFGKLGVELRLNSYLDADDIRELGADVVVLATGSLPDEERTQRWLPQLGPLPGREHGNVFAPEEVMRREAKIADTVIVYDEGGNMRGVGTAWHLAETGKQVVLVTPDPFVGKELARTSADIPIRAKLAQLGVRMLSEHAIAGWHGQGAAVRNLLDGSEEEIAASALVMATTNRSFEPVSAELTDLNLRIVGDAQAPRQAPFAFYEGRKCGLEI